MLKRRHTKKGGAASLAGASAVLVLSCAWPAPAQDTQLARPSVGAALRASFVHTDPDDGDSGDRFLVESARLYVNGSVSRKVFYTFNTDYNGATNDLAVIDAVAQFAFSPRLNVWVGRFIPPTDRANLYGPYYASHWGVFTDGVQGGYPFVVQGRDDGAMYWGRFGKVRVSAGAFDGLSATGDDRIIGAGRVQVDLWDPEPGYYSSGTYYGGKNVLALGAAGQLQGDDKTAWNLDVLLERKVGKGGAFSAEGEWAKYNRLGGYNRSYGTSDGGYVLGSYLFPPLVGSGRFQVLAKHAHVRFRDGALPSNGDFDQDTTELNLNYVMRQFNSRLMLFFRDTRFDAVRVDFRQIGVGLQVQM